MKNLNQNSGFKIFHYVLLLSTLLCISNSYAQKFENSNKIEQATLVLTDGAKIFSTDEVFNKQITSKIVILKNADLAPQNKNSTKVFEATSSKEEILKKDFKQEIKNAVEEKQKDELKNVKKEIEKHEVRKDAFLKFDFNDIPSSSNFLSSNSSLKNYVVPSHNGNDFSKIYASSKDYSVKRALNYLHAAKYTYYNSKSLDCCFSQVYSVRPPPAIQVFS